jgi:hypothetical protein
MKAVRPPANVAKALRDGLAQATWRTIDLWIHAFALGSNLTVVELGSVLAGDRPLTENEYRLLSAALNEEFDDIGSERMPRWAAL